MTDKNTPNVEDTAEGQSFDNPALRGSGVILPGGEIGPSQPDPTLVRGLGGHKTSGGRTVVGGGLGDSETVETGPSSTEDPATAKQATNTRRGAKADEK